MTEFDDYEWAEMLDRNSKNFETCNELQRPACLKYCLLVIKAIENSDNPNPHILKDLREEYQKHLLAESGERSELQKLTRSQYL